MSVMAADVMGLSGVVPGVLAAAPAYSQWGVLGILFLIAAGFAVGNVVLSTLLGPSKKGVVKDTPYESGVDPIGSTHQRFNVRFYLVAMIFLVFDVEVLFFIPWVVLFPHVKTLKAFAATHGYTLPALSPGGLFAAVLTFAAIVLLAYVYAWGKGVFKWD